jgi:hypothetical protein
MRSNNGGEVPANASPRVRFLLIHHDPREGLGRLSTGCSSACGPFRSGPGPLIARWRYLADVEIGGGGVAGSEAQVLGVVDRLV